MPVKPLFSAAGISFLLLCGSASLRAQELRETHCFRLDIEDPGVHYMLGKDVNGDTLVLSSDPLEDSPGASRGARAYIGLEPWRERGPLKPSSWYWEETSQDQVRVGFVLPLWGIVWTAGETPDGLAGEVAYQSDEVGDPPRTSTFRGVRVPCGSRSRPTPRPRTMRTLILT